MAPLHAHSYITAILQAVLKPINATAMLIKLENIEEFQK